MNFNNLYRNIINENNDIFLKPLRIVIINTSPSEGVMLCNLLKKSIKNYFKIKVFTNKINGIAYMMRKNTTLLITDKKITSLENYKIINYQNNNYCNNDNNYKNKIIIVNKDFIFNNFGSFNIILNNFQLKEKKKIINYNTSQQLWKSILYRKVTNNKYENIVFV